MEEKAKRILVSTGIGCGQLAKILCKGLFIIGSLGLACMVSADLIEKRQRSIKFNH